jgi:6-phosphogluconate dehydrogenase
MNLPHIAEVWRRGSVIGSWLLDLTAAALQERFTSRGQADFSYKIVSAMRQEFGGHSEEN